MKRKLFSLFLALITLLMILGTTQPVSAKGPVTITIDLDYHVADLGTCQDPIALHSTGYYETTSWFDDSGRLVKHFEAWQNDTVTLAGNGKSLSVNVVGPAHYRLDWVSETQAEVFVYTAGPSMLGVVPKTGPIFGNTGLIIQHLHMTITDEGPVIEDQGIVFDHGLKVTDLTDFCAYFDSTPIAQ
jgi:hypothetical protein